MSDNQQLNAMMAEVQSMFQPEKAAGVDATVQFHLTGDHAGDYIGTIRDQKLDMQPGTVPNPNLWLSANTADLYSIFTGKLNPMSAYMQGKVQFKGDMGLAMKLMELFKKPSR